MAKNKESAYLTTHVVLWQINMVCKIDWLDIYANTLLHSYMYFNVVRWLQVVASKHIDVVGGRGSSVGRALDSEDPV